MISSKTKLPAEKVAFAFDFSADLGTATIASFVEVVSPTGQLTVGTKSKTNQAVNLRLDGGNAGTAYVITVTATATDGQVWQRQGVVVVLGAAVGPALNEPITAVEAKKHLRVGGTADDQLIAGFVAAARSWVEDYTGLVLTRREVTEALRKLDVPTRLNAWPIDAAQPIVIVYRDTSGAEQTIADAGIRATSRPGALYPPAGAQWPSSCTIDGAITATFTAGYADPSEVPPVLKQAMLVLLTGFYEDREGGATFAAAQRSAGSMCDSYRRWAV